MLNNLELFSPYLMIALLLTGFGAQAQAPVSNVPSRDWSPKLEPGVEEMQSALQLEDGPSEKLAGVMNEFYAKVAEIKDPTDPVGEDRGIQMHRLLVERDAALQAMLDAQQFAVVLGLRAQRMKKVGGGGK